MRPQCKTAVLLDRRLEIGLLAYVGRLRARHAVRKLVHLALQPQRYADERDAAHGEQDALHARAAAPSAWRVW